MTSIIKRFRSRVGRKQNHSIWGTLFIFVLLAATAAFMALPFVFAVVQSLKPAQELFVFPPRFYVESPTISNFTDLFLRTNNMWVPFERYIFNSLVIALFGTGTSVIVCALGAFPLSHFQFPGSRMFEKMVVLALLFVYEVTFIPQYVLLSGMGLIDNILSLILPSIAWPLGFYLMKNFMTQIPGDLIEAATIDGAGLWKTFWAVIMPNVKPAWITLVILSFQSLWNRDTGSYIFTEKYKNLPALFRQISNSGTIATTGIASAAAVTLMIPPIIIFLISQKKILQTMVFSGIKG